ARGHDIERLRTELRELAAAEIATARDLDEADAGAVRVRVARLRVVRRGALAGGGRGLLARITGRPGLRLARGFCDRLLRLLLQVEEGIGIRHEEEDIGKAVSVRVEDSHRVRRRAAGLELRPRDEARILSVRLEEDEVVRGAFALGDDEQRRALVRAFAAFARLGAEEQGTEVRADLRRKPQGLRKIEAAVLPTRHADRLLLAADDDDLGAGLEIDRRAGETVHARV